MPDERRFPGFQPVATILRPLYARIVQTRMGVRQRHGQMLEPADGIGEGEFLAAGGNPDPTLQGGTFQVSEPLLDPVEPVLDLVVGHAAASPDLAEAQPAGASARVQAINGRDHLEVLDPVSFYGEVERTALKEPTAVAVARALISDPRAAVLESDVQRQVAWLVAGADLRHRRASAAQDGRTVA